jgi:hypothetical protein
MALILAYSGNPELMFAHVMLLVEERIPIADRVPTNRVLFFSMTTSDKISLLVNPLPVNPVVTVVQVFPSSVEWNRDPGL